MLSVEVRTLPMMEAAVYMPSRRMFVYVGGAVSAYLDVSGEGRDRRVMTLFAPSVHARAVFKPVYPKGWTGHRMHKCGGNLAIVKNLILRIMAYTAIITFF